MDPKTGLYSKAAKIIRSYPSERGTAEQMVAFAKKAGIKPAELERVKLPTGPITRDELAQHFERSLPSISVEQYGENPKFLTSEQNRRRQTLNAKARTAQGMDDSEQAELEALNQVHLATPNVISTYDEDTGYKGAAPTVYDDYTLDDGKNYRERLLKLGMNDQELRRKLTAQGIETDKRKMEYEAPIYGGDPNHPRMQQMADHISKRQGELEAMGGEYKEPKYQSSHWAGHPNVLAHIRLSDREVGPTTDFSSAKAWVQPVVKKIADHMGAAPSDLGSGAAKYAVQNGLITPEEAATLTKIKGWQNEFTGQKGLGKRLLHVEELQSDWAQQGRDQGFNTGEATKAYQDHIADLKGRFRQKLSWMGDEAAIDKRMDNTLVSEMAYALGEGDKHKELGKAAADEGGKVPQAPYVGNTQHWTDLALKNVLREAAVGNYDGVVFTPGQAQADRYGLEKQVDSIKYWPQDRTLSALQGNSTRVAKQDVGPEDLPGLIGKELSEKLLHPDSVRKSEYDGSTYHMLQGDEMKVGGQGMKGFYDNIVPKSVMRLAQMHDPDIKPGEPVDLPQGYQGFHLPMTDKLRQGVMNEGYPAFKRGGKVDAALAVTRRFTKDGKGAMMDLKSQ